MLHSVKFRLESVQLASNTDASWYNQIWRFFELEFSKFFSISDALKLQIQASFESVFLRFPRFILAEPNRKFGKSLFFAPNHVIFSKIGVFKHTQP